MRAPLAVLVLVGLTLLAGCSSKPAYPDKYILKGDELPEGLTLSQLPPGFAMGSNPGQIPGQMLAALSPELGGLAPDQAWAEFVERSQVPEGDPGGGLMIASGYWVDAAKAQEAIDKVRQVSQDGVCKPNNAGVALRDNNVLVVIGGDEEMASYVPQIEAKLKSKATGLSSLCS